MFTQSHHNPNIQRSRGWCFTLNNWDGTSLGILQTRFEAGNPVYVCWGKETGESGTPHLQGYARFRDAIGLSGVRKLLEPLIGSRAKAQSPKQSRIVKKTGTLQSLGIELHQERGRTSRPSSPVCEREPERLSSANLTLWNLLNSIEPPKSFGEEWEFPDKRKLQSIGITDPLVLEKADRLSKRMREPTGKI